MAEARPGQRRHGHRIKGPIARLHRSQQGLQGRTLHAIAALTLVAVPGDDFNPSLFGKLCIASFPFDELRTPEAR